MSTKRHLHERHEVLPRKQSRIKSAKASWNARLIYTHSVPTQQRVRRIFEVLTRRQTDLTVLADDVYKPHNLSAILRTCDAVGIGRAHAVTPTGGIPTYVATSASADKWVDLDVFDDIDVAIDGLQAAGMQIIAAHFSDEAVDYRDIDYTQPTTVVLGNERDGVRARAAARADAHAIIPMLGMVQSLNVSVAAAVILFEAQRQRRQAGLYDRPQLTPEVMNEQAFRWLHPHLATECDLRGHPIPWLDMDGEPIADGSSDGAWAQSFTS